MASKIKVDQLETADGTGTIALQNQLSGMTGASMPTGAVLQVKQTMKTDTMTTTSTSWVDVTGLSVSITPSSTSNKILVTVDLNMGQDSGFRAHGRVLRDSTAIAVGDAAGSRSPSTFASRSQDYGYVNNTSATILDSPSTTSAVTYKVQVMSENSSGNVYTNRSGWDTDNSTYPRTVSIITVQEIKG